VVENGVLAVVNSDSMVTLAGDLGFVPQDVARFSPLAFTPDGTELAYQNRQNMVAAANVDTGDTQIIGPCPPEVCDAALSPDAQRLASHGRADGDSGLMIRTVGSNEGAFLPTPGVEPYFPVWSPDGQTLAFIAAQGLYTIAADGTGLRLLHRITDRYHLSSSRLAWSPDGQLLAFLDSAVYERASGAGGDTQPLTFSLMTIRADGTQPQVLRDLGRCVCVGISPPALTWSPDGTMLAVSSIRNGRGVFDARTGPLYLLRPDGSVEDTIGGGGSIHSITWQPLPK
jgi:Tol biopolymer transport system component